MEISDISVLIIPAIFASIQIGLIYLSLRIMKWETKNGLVTLSFILWLSWFIPFYILFSFTIFNYRFNATEQIIGVFFSIISSLSFPMIILYKSGKNLETASIIETQHSSKFGYAKLCKTVLLMVALVLFGTSVLIYGVSFIIKEIEKRNPKPEFTLYDS